MRVKIFSAKSLNRFFRQTPAGLPRWGPRLAPADPANIQVESNEMDYSDR